MAFRTNKVPAIEERSVSGSSVSFNSAFALPLKACKVSFSATQAGSGDPSPSNPRAISGVSAIGLTANSTPVSISLGEERFGGELDVVTGILTVTHISALLNARTWTRQSGTPTRYLTQPLVPNKSGKSKVPICEIFKGNNVNWVNDTIVNGSGGDYAGWISIFTDRYESLDDFYTAINGYYYVYEIDNPITIQLSENELSSIIGNNTFSTDTGTLEITFADLQEKSASGSVASFNTALNMPLSKGEFSVTAYQEGSGDPSPVNVRNIVPRREVNIIHNGKNLLKGLSGTGANVTIDYDQTSGEYTLNGIASGNYLYVVDLPCELPVGAFCVSAINNITSDVIIRLQTSYGTTVRTFNLNNLNPYISFTTDSHISRYVIRLNGGTNYNNYKFKLQLEVGSTATAYEVYKDDNNLVNLGEEIVGGSYNSVTGDKEKTWTKELIKNLDIGYTSQNNYFYVLNVKKIGNDNLMSDVLKYDNSGVGSMSNYSLKGNGNNGHIYIKATDYTSVEAFKEALGDYHIAYELIEPIESNIGATPIETYDGSNNIFADTGDVDLTYKDLDIAKRGNFREVFRLPS